MSAASSNTTLIPVAAIVLGGSGAKRTVKVTPTTNASGSATITLTVSDGALSATSAFTVTVKAVNDAPTIAKPADVVVAKNGVKTVTVTIGDKETAVGSLRLNATSSNTTLLPNANLVLGGTTANRTLKLTPVANKTGVATITLTVSDGALSATTTFKVTVQTPPTIAAIADQTTNEDTAISALAVKIGDAETAASALTVSGASSNLTLLPVANLVFGGSGANRTLKLTPAKNQSGTATVTVSVSDGTLSTSTTFKLTVKAVNDAPTISAIANQKVNKNVATSALAFTIGDVETAATSLTLTKASSNTTLVPVANIVFGGSGANRTVKVTPAKDKTGTAKITVTVSDGSATTSTSFTLTVNAPPTISTITNQTVAKNVATKALAFTIGDAETAAASLTLTKTSSNPTLVPAAAIVFGGSGASRTVKVTPAKDKTGSAKITLTVSDGFATTSTSFTVTVGSASKSSVEAAAAAPAIARDLTDRIVKTGEPVSFTVTTTSADDVTYRWFKDEAPLVDATQATLTIASAALTDAGGYRVTVANTLGAVTSRTAELTVVEAQATAKRVSADTLVVTQTLAIAGEADGVRLSVLLPAGWSYRGGSGALAATAPQSGDTDLIEWTWTEALVQPLTFAYTLKVPANAALPAALDLLLQVRQSDATAPLQ